MSDDVASVSEDETPRRHGLIEALADKRASHKERGRVYRLLFMIAGVIVTGVGVAMLVTPGPALAVIPIGLAMLALEFVWAERMLERALDHAEKAKQTAVEASRTQKILAAIATVLGIAAFVTAAILWDLPGPVI